MRSLCPAGTRAQTPALPRNSNGWLDFPGPTQEEAWNPRRNSRIPPQLEKNHVAFYLQPNATYVFQVRCQETGKRYWQPWSSPFFHKTPEIGECISIFNLFGFSFDFCLSSKFISFFLPDFYQNWQNYSRASQLSSVAQSCPTLCNPHGLQHARLPCPSPKPTRAGDNI